MYNIKLVNTKQLGEILNVSQPTAKKYMEDIREHFSLTKCNRITEEHLLEYFGTKRKIA